MDPLISERGKCETENSWGTLKFAAGDRPVGTVVKNLLLRAGQNSSTDSMIIKVKKGTCFVAFRCVLFKWKLIMSQHFNVYIYSTTKYYVNSVNKNNPQQKHFNAVLSFQFCTQ